MPPSVQWEIVGGSDKGGILVRDDESTKSAQTGRTSEATFFLTYFAASWRPGTKWLSYTYVYL